MIKMHAKPCRDVQQCQLNAINYKKKIMNEYVIIMFYSGLSSRTISIQQF